MQYGVIDYRISHPATKGDFALMRGLARQLIGEPVLFGAISYPRELTIHFGSPVEFRGPKGKVLTEGTYVLGTVGSAWNVKSAPQGRQVVDMSRLPRPVGAMPPYPAISDGDFKQFLKKLSGTTVRDVDIYNHKDGYSLQVFFSDGSLVEVIPTSDHFAEVDVNDPFPVPPPDWELFTPYNHYLRVGPGFEWRYAPSDKPEEAPVGK